MKIIFQKATLAIGLCAMVATQTATAQADLKPLDPVKCIKVGSNINISANGSFFPFVDFFKCNTGWSKDQYAISQFDKDGYKINGGTQTTSIYLDEVPMNTEFTIMWDGAPKDTLISPLKVTGMSINSLKQNSKGGSLKAQKLANIIYISIVNGQVTADLNNLLHIRNIRIIRKGFESTYLTNPFNPEFLEQVKEMSYIKVNHWMSNYDTKGIKSDWKKRTTLSSMSQVALNTTSDFVDANVAQEHIIQLANITKKDCWVNIPYDADPDYVSKMAQLYKTNLNSDIKLLVETSHEIWNFGSYLVAYKYFSSAVGYNVQRTEDTIAYIIKRNWRIWKGVFGDRVQSVLGAQSGYAPKSLLYFSTDRYINNDKFDVLAIAMYINLDKQQSNKIMALGSNTTPALLNQAALDSWKSGSTFRYFYESESLKIETGGLVVYSKAAKQANAKLMIYDGNTEYNEFNNLGTYTQLPKAEEAYMHKVSIAPLFVAVFDTLKKYGVEAYTFSNFNGSKSSANYSLMGGTFTNNTIVSNELMVDAKYQVVKEYAANQECLITNVFEGNNQDMLNDVVVFPNPTKGSFQITSTNFENGKVLVECYNSIGKRVYQGQLNVAENIDILGNQPSGIYHLQVISGGKKVVKKVVKE